MMIFTRYKCDVSLCIDTPHLTPPFVHLRHIVCCSCCRRGCHGDMTSSCSVMAVVTRSQYVELCASTHQWRTLAQLSLHKFHCSSLFCVYIMRKGTTRDKCQHFVYSTSHHRLTLLTWTGEDVNSGDNDRLITIGWSRWSRQWIMIVTAVVCRELYLL